MTFPNPTLTWSRSADAVPSTTTDGTSVLAALNTAITTTTGWEVVDGGDGTEDFLVIKPSSASAEVNKMRIVFGHNASVATTVTEDAYNVSGYMTMSMVINAASDAAGTTFPIDVVDAASTWASADIWSGIHADHPAPLKFVPCSFTVGASYPILSLYVIASEEVLCVVFRTSESKCSPNWMGAMLSPLGSPGAGDANDRMYAACWAGSSAYMISTSLSTGVSTSTKAPFGKSYYNYLSGYHDDTRMKIYDTDTSGWELGGMNNLFYTGYNQYRGAADTVSHNRDIVGNICLARTPILRKYLQGSGNFMAASEVRCYGYLRQIYPWGTLHLDRETVLDANSAEIGYVVAPHTSTEYEAWVHLNA
jgi:hypothetical protein